MNKNTMQRIISQAIGNLCIVWYNGSIKINGGLTMSNSETIRARDQIPQEDTGALEDLYPSDES